MSKENSGESREAQQPRRSRPKRASCFGSYGISAAGVTDVDIYYGTMFGVAERFARALAHEISVHQQSRVSLYDLDAFDEGTFARRDRLVPSRLVVIIVSTHFAGAPSPSAERFRDWIRDLAANPRRLTLMKGVSSRRAIEPDPGGTSLWPFNKRGREPLRGMLYTVFGVGDSIYLTYNAMGKLVDLKLKQLGAFRFHALGLGDSSGDIDAMFHAWQSGLLAKLPGHSEDSSIIVTKPKTAPNVVAPLLEDKWAQSKRFTNPKLALKKQPSVIDNFGVVVSLGFGCRILGKEEIETSQLYTLYPSSSTRPSVRLALRGPRTPRIALFDPSPFAEIEVTEVRPSYGSNLSSRRAATFLVHLQNPETTYISVSTLAIFPQNDHPYVQRLAEAFHFDLDAVIELIPYGVEGTSLKSRLQQLPFPTPCTVRTVLSEFLEIRTVTREFVRAAAGFVTSPGERAMLEHLSSTNGSTEFRTEIVEQYRGILELLELAPSLRIPLEVFVTITPPLKPRFYSIASSPKLSAHEIEIAVSLGVTGQPQGLCVSFLERIASLPLGTRIPFRGFISWSRFQFPDDGVSPLVLIAMGVGWSAMRSIIQERIARWFQTQQKMSSKRSQSRPGSRNLSSAMPPLLLFLGATSKEHIVFRHDLTHWEQQMMVKVHYGFSNDPQHTKRRVNEVVANRIEEIVDVVKSSTGSRVFVCGRVGLVKNIRALFEADQLRRGIRWFDTLNSSGRFMEEGFN